MIKNTLIFSLLTIFVTNNAIANNTSNIRISANALSGCKVTASDISFGDLALTTTSNDKQYELKDLSFSIQCSKGSNVKLGVRGKNHPAANSGTFMTIGGVPMTDWSGSQGIQYRVLTTNIVNTPDFTVTARPTYNWLVSQNTFYLGMNIHTGNQIKLPLKGVISSSLYFDNKNDFKKLKPGNYIDDMSYELTF